MKKLTLDMAKKIAKDNNGECLSKQYINSKEKLLWKCSNNHIWKSTLSCVKYMKAWCPKCAGIEKAKFIMQYNKKNI